MASCSRWTPYKGENDSGCSETIAGLSCSKPFLFQLAGEQAWYADVSPVSTKDDVLTGWSGIAVEAEQHVHGIIDRLPEKERLFLEAMAELRPDDRLFSAIATQAGYMLAVLLDAWRWRED